MPTRLLREGILSSDRVDRLDFPAEVFYRRLMSKVDDHGLYDARPLVLRASLYPLRVDRVREADISRWIATCETAGLIVLYEADNKPYLKVLDTRWQARSDPKFPVPPPSVECTTVNNCKHLYTKSLSLSESLSKTLSVHVDRENEFLQFWESYPRHENKKKARELFLKTNPEDLQKILAALVVQKKSESWRKDGGKYIPHPTTWLNGRRWEDEVTISPVNGGITSFPNLKETLRRLDAEPARS